MNSTEGLHSYACNSSYQKGGVDSAKAIIYKEISENLGIRQVLSSSNLFNIADLGCSVGPNTFSAVQNVIEAVEFKSQAEGMTSEDLEFQVFFNDHVTNDFNTLFKSIPLEKQYYAAGVPGSFHSRLFPKASLHFVHSSYALHWLSRVPHEVVDKDSPAWNKERIHYGSAEVEGAYLAQYVNDMESFLAARAEELVHGGFMALLVPSIPTGADPLKCMINAVLHLLGSSLMDIAKMGLVDEAKVESFNLPAYNTSPEKLEAIIERNGCFSIEIMEQLVRPMPAATRPNILKFTSGIRANLDGLFRENFGDEVIDQLFDRFTEKMIESVIFEDENYKPFIDLFLLLKYVETD